MPPELFDVGPSAMHPIDSLLSTGSKPTRSEVQEIRQETEENSANIFTYYYMLSQILESHEAIIQRRWNKKTRQQRLKKMFLLFLLLSDQSPSCYPVSYW